MHTAQIWANFAQNQPSKRLLAKTRERSHLMISKKPSQALPRQLPRRGSQAITFVAKALGTMKNLATTQKKLPLSGELASRSDD